MPTVLRNPRALLAALALAALVAFLHGVDLGRYALWDPDEARHAEVAREMAAGSGLARFFLPTLEEKPYREKPAFYYVLVTRAYALLGTGERGARAVSATAATTTVLAVFAFALPRVGLAEALGAALVLVTSVGWFWLGRYGNLDMTFTACVTLGVLAGLAWLDRAPPRRPPFAVWVALGLAILVKGPLALALVGGPLVLAVALRGQRPAWPELGVVRGLALTGALVALFYLPAAALDWSYVQHFLHTHFRRLEATAPHHAPPWFYLAWLPVLTLPWSALAVPAATAAARTPEHRAWLAWALFVPALMSCISSKLPTYVLPALPALALVVGPWIVRVARRGPSAGERPWIVGAAAVTAALLAVGGIAILVVRRHYPLAVLDRVGGAVLLLGGAGLAGVFLRRGEPERVAPLVLVVTLVLHPLAVHRIAAAVSALHSDAAMAEAIAAYPAAPVIAFDTQSPSLVFYRQQPLEHTHEPGRVQALFAGDAPAFLVTGKRDWATVEALLGEHAHVWHETPRRRLYGNRPR